MQAGYIAGYVLGLAVFIIYGCMMAQMMFRMRKVTWFHAIQLGLASWMSLALVFMLFVLHGDFDDETFPLSLLVPAAQLSKDLSGMAVLVVWSWVSAARFQDLGVRNTWVFIRALECVVPVFAAFFLAAVVVLFYPPPLTPENIEMLESSRATLYRSLTATPILVYAVVMIYVTFRFSLSSDGRNSRIRRRFEYFAGVWAASAVWCFLYTGWFTPVGTVSEAIIGGVLAVGCTFGWLASRPEAERSKADKEIGAFEDDQGTYNRSQYAAKGYLDEELPDRWQETQDLLGLVVAWVGPRHVDEKQHEAAQNGLYLAEHPREREAAENTNIQPPAPETEFNPTPYGIPEECADKEEIEREMEVHHRACWMADILSHDQLAQILPSQLEWVQIGAVVAARVGMLTPQRRAEVLDHDYPCVDPRYLELVKGRDKKRSQIDGS